jgi:hypothetical protein
MLMAIDGLKVSRLCATDEASGYDIMGLLRNRREFSDSPILFGVLLLELVGSTLCILCDLWREPPFLWTVNYDIAEVSTAMNLLFQMPQKNRGFDFHIFTWDT